MRSSLVVVKDGLYWAVGNGSDLDCLNLKMSASEEMSFRDYAVALYRGELRPYDKMMEYQDIMRKIAEKNQCQIHNVPIDQFDSGTLYEMDKFVTRVKPYRRLVGVHASVVVSPKYWRQAAFAIIGTRDPEPEKSVDYMAREYKPFHMTFDSQSMICTMTDYFSED